jgi:hypothetical protein
MTAVAWSSSISMRNVLDGKTLQKQHRGAERTSHRGIKWVDDGRGGYEDNQKAGQGDDKESCSTVYVSDRARWSCGDRVCADR